jgi:hypothetical protein
MKSALSFRTLFSLRAGASLLLFALVCSAPVRASRGPEPAFADELSALIKRGESVRRAYESYTAASLKEPSKTAARRLSIKLDGLMNDLDAYLIGKADQSLVTSRIDEALVEGKRYKTTQAKALVADLTALKKHTLKLPRRLAAADVQWVRNQSATQEVAAAEHKTTPLTDDKADAKTTKSKAKPASDDEESETLAEDSKPEDAKTDEAPTVSAAEPASTDSVGSDAGASAVERYTDSASDASEAATASEASTGSAGSLPSWIGWVLFALVVFSLGLLAAVWAQGRQVTQLRQQVEDGLIALAAPRRPDTNRADTRTEELLTALRADFTQRWEALQTQTAEFAQRLDARFGALEKSNQNLTQAQHSLTDRFAGFEALEATVAKLEAAATTAPKSNGNHAPTAPLAAPLMGSPASFHPTDRDLLIGLLDQLQATTQLQPLADRARSVMQGYQPESSPDPIRTAVSPLELAELVQLAYLSTLTEPTQDVYQQIVEVYKREHLLVEDKMIGRMAFSDYYAENYTADQLREVEVVATVAGVWPLPVDLITSGVSKSPLDKVAVKGTVLYTALPTVLRQSEGVKAVLRKGLYVIKG